MTRREAWFKELLVRFAGGDGPLVREMFDVIGPRTCGSYSPVKIFLEAMTWAREWWLLDLTIFEVRALRRAERERDALREENRALRARLEGVHAEAQRDGAALPTVQSTQAVAGHRVRDPRRPDSPPAGVLDVWLAVHDHRSGGGGGTTMGVGTARDDARLMMEPR
jgi:hypothetical protein